MYVYICVYVYTNLGEIIRWSGLQGQPTRHVTKKTIHTLTSINPKTLTLCWNSNFDLKNWTGSVKVKTKKNKKLFIFNLHFWSSLSLSVHHHHHRLAATSFHLNVGNISALVKYQFCSFFCGTEAAYWNAS